LHASEELIEGEIQSLKHGQKDSVWVTISDGMQETLQLNIGDSLSFDVQGVEIKAYISGIRKVDWPKDPPNFIFVFPAGVLEIAPQIWVVATRISEVQSANRFQQELVTGFPNVSLIDLRLILSTVNKLFDKVSLLIRFMALFSIVTGLIVLAGAVMNSKFARMKENVLLRTLGARSAQVLKITIIEYSYIGVISALTGLVLSLGGGYLVTRFFFEIQFSVNLAEVLYISFGVILLTVLIGWYNSREVLSSPPLQILRKEN
jgi:putative ABC transport system permease protein